MERLLQHDLVTWKNKSTRKPILLDGARQVGKSYLLRHKFGAEHFKEVHVFDFLKSPDICQLFTNGLDPRNILNKLSLFKEKSIDPTQDLIIFDEIGECPKALQSLKFIAEDEPTWFVCASGSNVGLLNSFPVGKVQTLTLRPMNFEEFLLAHKNELLYEAFKNRDRSLVVFNKLWSLLVNFIFVGGMPEAVASWVASQESLDLERRRDVRAIQSEILSNYKQDFGKYAGAANALHLEMVFSNVANQLQKEIRGSVKRYRFKDVIHKKAGYRDFKSLIAWLEKTHLVSKSFIVDTPKVPLSAYASDSFFKLFHLDVGLLCRELGISSSVLELADVTYKGPIIENFLQNELLSYGASHTYGWSANTSRVEFLLQVGDETFPVEVKAGVNTKAKSLRTFQKKYAPSKTFKFIGSAGGTDTKDQVWPLFYADILREYL